MRTIFTVLISFIFSTAIAGNQDWPTYGGAPGGGHYSRLAQINLKNVAHLKRAWTYHTGDVSDGSHGAAQTAFEATPIYYHHLLYFCTPFNRVIALNPVTGRKVWSFNPHLSVLHKKWGSAEGNLICRGVAAWHNRIFTVTQDTRLIALNAKTGAFDASHGEPKAKASIPW